MKLRKILMLMTIIIGLSACKKEMGCTDPLAINYDVIAEEDDGSCEYTQIGVDNCIELTENIDVPTTLEAGKYKICYQISVNAGLTIMPGCTFIMCEGSAITVNNEGFIDATGTADEQIIIKGEVATKGYWQGLAIKSNNPNNKLINVQISDGGTYWAWEYATVYVTGNAQLNISESMVSNSDNFGLFIQDGGFLSGFSMNTFSDNTIGLSIAVDQVKHLDSGSSYNVNNTFDFIDARNGSISTNAVWQALTTPLVVNEVYIYGSLTINPGSNILVESAGIIYVDETGYITSNGTADEPVILKGRFSSPGFWNGMRIVSNNPNNKMTYTLIGDGGSYWAYEYANIHVYGRLDISNSIIQNANSYGIYADNGSTILGDGVGMTSAGQVEAINTFLDNGNGPDSECADGCSIYFE